MKSNLKIGDFLYLYGSASGKCADYHGAYLEKYVIIADNKKNWKVCGEGIVFEVAKKSLKVIGHSFKMLAKLPKGYEKFCDDLCKLDNSTTPFNDLKRDIVCLNKDKLVKKYSWIQDKEI